MNLVITQNIVNTCRWDAIVATEGGILKLGVCLVTWNFFCCFLKLLLSRSLYVCVSTLRASVTTYIKCICNNQLLKPFPQHLSLPLIKWIGVDLITQHIANTCHYGAIFTTEGGILATQHNKMECFSY